MLRGFIDNLTSSGLVEGWAYDESKPLEPLLVAIVGSKDNRIATGLANLFRQDLANAKCGYGWCYFRLFVDHDLTSILQDQMRLISVESGAVICEARAIDYSESQSYVVDNLECIVENDPTILHSLEYLEYLEEIYANFIVTSGVEAFVRAAYLYILGRPCDDSGLHRYSRLVRQGRLSPYALLRTLADSLEFKAKPRGLMAPTQPGFPFRVLRQ